MEGRYATAVTVGPLHRGRLFHVHHKALYAAIGETDSRHRKPATLGRFIERVMVLDGVLADPTLTWLGTEADKRTYSRTRGDNRLELRQLPQLLFGTGAQTTTRYFPDKLPIGIDASRTDHVLLYLVTRAAPIDFRMFLWRHHELLRSLHRWTLRLLVPKERARAFPQYLHVAREELATPLNPALVDELTWYFHERKRLHETSSQSTERRFHLDVHAYRRPRFAVLYRRWLERGDDALWLTQSDVLRMALERGEARIECVELPHQYLHLTRLVVSRETYG